MTSRQMPTSPQTATRELASYSEATHHTVLLGQDRTVSSGEAGNESIPTSPTPSSKWIWTDGMGTMRISVQFLSGTTAARLRLSFGIPALSGASPTHVILEKTDEQLALTSTLVLAEYNIRGVPWVLPWIDNLVGGNVRILVSLAP